MILMVQESNGNELAAAKAMGESRDAVRSALRQKESPAVVEALASKDLTEFRRERYGKWAAVFNLAFDQLPVAIEKANPSQLATMMGIAEDKMNGLTARAPDREDQPVRDAAEATKVLAQVMSSILDRDAQRAKEMAEFDKDPLTADVTVTDADVIEENN